MQLAKRIKKTLLGCALMINAAGCVSLQSVSLTQIPAKRDNKVTASTDKWIILGFNFDNDYVDKLTEKLKDKCENGQIRGILTKDETTSYFLVFKRSVTATGYCIKA
ncbi:MAG: hypothetical protein RIQ81_691 [Pseudomonadota bacterium]|jgi:dihydroorotate dehydrogenase